MDTQALEKMLEAAAGTPHAEYLAADMRRILPALTNPALMKSAVAALQAWADAPGESLRKAFSSEFLARARASLGSHSVQDVVGRHAMPVKPGQALTQSSAVERFRQQPFLIHEDAPAGRLEEMHQPDTEALDEAHRSGARMAAKAAKHSFRLGVLAGSAAGAGANHVLSERQRAERSTAAKARWARVKHGPSTPMAKIFGVHGHVMPSIPDSAIWNNHDGGDCPTCGKHWPKMAKADIQRPPPTDTDMSAQAAAYAADDPNKSMWSPDMGGKCPTCGWDWPAKKAAGAIDLSKVFDAGKQRSSGDDALPQNGKRCAGSKIGAAFDRARNEKPKSGGA